LTELVRPGPSPNWLEKLGEKSLLRGARPHLELRARETVGKNGEKSLALASQANGKTDSWRKKKKNHKVRTKKGGDWGGQQKKPYCRPARSPVHIWSVKPGKSKRGLVEGKKNIR